MLFEDTFFKHIGIPVVFIFITILKIGLRVLMFDIILFLC